jgi:hypothetical protein
VDSQIDPPETPYPPAPWRMRGSMWMGLLPTDQPTPCPAGLVPILPRRLVVGVVRYKEGTLRYDEFLVGTMVRLGRRAGIFVHGIWVDDLASLWGGRRIWGLDKQLAEFHWTGEDTVTITGERGTLAALTVDRRSPQLPPAWLPMTGIGSLGDDWAFVTGRIRARIGTGRMRVTDWAPHLPALRARQARMCTVSRSFRMTVPAPALIPRG